jgi:ribose transport system substrate-binding protein
MTPVLDLRDITQQNSFVIRDGATQYAKSLKKPLKVVVYNSDSDLEISNVRGALSAGPALVNSWPNTAETTPQLVQAVQSAGGYLVTQWNKPDSLHPWDVGDHYVAHIAFDVTKSAVTLCDALFKGMGGSGGFCAVEGLLDATNAQQGITGFKKAAAQTPGIKLLDAQPGDWDRTKAINLTKTWISRYGNELKGIWCANDDMALGVVQAVKAAGKTGKILVTGSDGVPDAINAVKSGDLLATMLFDSYWQGGIGLALANAAASGKITPSKEPNSHREFYGPQNIITKDNADTYLAPKNPADYNFDDLWGLSDGQIQY